jgi:hypothetical protein
MVSHVRDRHTGELRHASAMVGDHSTDQSDVHPLSNEHGEDHACVILASLHQAARAAVARPVVFAPPTADRTPCPPVAFALRTATLYRFAPKTSPPTIG